MTGVRDHAVRPHPDPVRPHDDTARRRRRRRLVYLLGSLPVVIAMIVLAVVLIRPAFVMQGALSHYDAGRYEASADEAGRLLENNVIEPYLPWFNRGDANAAQELYTEAIDDFERALELAPKERKCDVRVNLALSWERLGDIYSAGGFPQGAVQLYQQAAAVIADGPECVPPEPSGEQLQEAERRVQEKLDQAQRRSDAADALDGEDDAGGRQEQLDKLEQLGKQGAQEKADGDAQQRGDEDGSPGFTDKPW
jgi:tetratricopeptide (TPR) repeat protein